MTKLKYITSFGINTISFRGLQIWQDFSHKPKNSDSLHLLKSNTKIYGILTFHCKICKTFVLV